MWRQLIDVLWLDVYGRDQRNDGKGKAEIKKRKVIVDGDSADEESGHLAGLSRW